MSEIQDDSSHDRARESDLAVLEANEYKQRRRLEKILDARDNVQATADLAWEQFVAGQISHDAKNIMIQRAVQSFIKEAYKLLQDYTRDADADKYWVGDPTNPLGTIERDWGADIIIQGLKDFLKADHIHTEEREQKVKRANMPPRAEVQTQEHTVPEDVSMEAFLTLVEFLDDQHDLEISFESIEVDEEGEPW